jgi:ribosomal RNA assembly protein
MDPETFVYEVKVPKERIGVIIGQDGMVKQSLQEHSHLKMHVDSQEGLVTLEGEDSIALYAARQVIKAIARGFNPEIAQLLLRQDYVLEEIKLTDWANTKDSVLRLKGRVIGMKGKSRENIEQLTGCFISVYGKTVCIVGELAWANVAKRAVEKLLGGSMHKTVWKYLETMRRKLKAEEMSQ